MALSCYLCCWSVQTALLVLLATATATVARLAADNLDGCHHWLRTCWAFTSLRQKVGMKDTSSKSGLGGLLLQVFIAERLQRRRHGFLTMCSLWSLSSGGCRSNG